MATEISPPAPMNFYNSLPLTDYVQPPTQAARLELLVGLRNFVHAAITTPYMPQAVHTIFGNKPTSTVIFKNWVNVWTRRFQMRYAKCAAHSNYTTSPQEPQTITLKSPTGDGVNIQVLSNFDHGAMHANILPGTTGTVKVIEGSKNDPPSPAANLDRVVRQTNTALYDEPNWVEFEVNNVHAICAIPILTGDTLP